MVGQLCLLFCSPPPHGEDCTKMILWILLILALLSLFIVLLHYATTPAKYDPAGKHILITGTSNLVLI